MIYLVGEHPRLGPVKIGYSATPEARLATLQGVADACRMPSLLHRPSLVLLDVVPGDVSTERAMHGRLADRGLVGEWFDLGWHRTMATATFRRVYAEVVRHARV